MKLIKKFIKNKFYLRNLTMQRRLSTTTDFINYLKTRIELQRQEIANLGKEKYEILMRLELKTQENKQLKCGIKLYANEIAKYNNIMDSMRCDLINKK